MALMPVVDPAFGGAGVPLGGQSLDHGIPVLLQAVREGVRSGQVLGADGGDPVVEVLAGAGGEDLSEGPDELVSGGGFRAAGEDVAELPAFVLAEAVGVAHHPAGDLSDARWFRAEGAHAASAPRPRVVAEDPVSALVAQAFELAASGREAVHTEDSWRGRAGPSAPAAASYG
ncbi:hypothetical protein ACFYZ9_38210 [Streptomyces sp. NPDC001691]|uniref:hypothetical protein n=1 Tax=Streptomyces sp. NPDC001691 TaxID=3364600 RepID=UPI0036B86FAA